MFEQFTSEYKMGDKMSNSVNGKYEENLENKSFAIELQNLEIENHKYLK